MSVFVNHEFAHTLDSEARGQRLVCDDLNFDAALLVAWRNDAQVVWWPVLAGINLFFAGLRLIQWGHGLKEEMRYRQKGAARRL